MDPESLFYIVPRGARVKQKIFILRCALRHRQNFDEKYDNGALLQRDREKDLVAMESLIAYGKTMARKSSPGSSFGTFLEQHLAAKKMTRQQVAAGLDITSSYVSMLCRGTAKPGLKLALRIQTWTLETFGEAFDVGRWA